MAKFVTDSAPDAYLDYIATADQFVLCNGQPATYADATTDSGSGGNALGEIAVDGTDFTKADGDTSGRKTTFAAQTGITADVGAVCDHFAWVDDTGSELLMVTTLSSSETLTAGNTYDTNALDLEVADPS